MAERLLRIGELAAAAGVTTRTVDFYTGLGLLVPSRRTGGNFRLYQATDVARVGVIRLLEAQGIRLEDVARALTAPGPDGSQAANEGDLERGPGGEASAGAAGHPLPLAELEEQVRALREVTARADPRALGVLATLTTRAQALIATAVLLGGELIGELPPL